MNPKKAALVRMLHAIMFKGGKRRGYKQLSRGEKLRVKAIIRLLKKVRGKEPTTALARPNHFLGLALTKDSRYVKWEDKAQKYFRRYQECAGRLKKSGQVPYPYSQQSGGAHTNCWKDFKKWSDAEQKRSQAAVAAMNKDERKGKLTQAMREDYEEAIRGPIAVSDIIYDAMIEAKEAELAGFRAGEGFSLFHREQLIGTGIPKRVSYRPRPDETMLENEQISRDPEVVRQRKKKKGRKGRKGMSDEDVEAFNAIPVDPEIAAEVAAEDGIFTMPVLIGGAVAVLIGGGVGIYFLTRKKAEPIPTSRRLTVEPTE